MTASKVYWALFALVVVLSFHDGLVAAVVTILAASCALGVAIGSHLPKGKAL